MPKHMTNEVKNPNYLSIEEVANLLNVSLRTARELVKDCEDVLVVKAGNGCANKMLYNLNEVNKIASVQQQNKKVVSSPVSLEDIDLVDVKTIANMMNITEQAVREKLISLNITPKKYVLKGKDNNVKTALYSWEEIKIAQQNKELAQMDKKTDTMINKFTDNELKLAFGKTLNDKSSKEIYHLSMQMIALALQKSEERLDKEREEKEMELKRKQQLIDTIEEQKAELEKYKEANKLLSASRKNRREIARQFTKSLRKWAFVKWGTCDNDVMKIAYHHWYNELEKQYCIREKVDINFLKRNPKYIEVLLDMIINDI